MVATGERRVLNLLTDGNVIRLNFLVLKTGRLQVNNFAIIKDMFCSILSSNIHELVLESPIANKSPSFNSCLPNSPFLCLYPCSRPPARPCPSHKKGSLCIGPSSACTARLGCTFCKMITCQNIVLCIQQQYELIPHNADSLPVGDNIHNKLEQQK